LIPIIRLCTVGNCIGFDSPDKIASFYQGVYQNSTGEFIAMVGPNEPYSDDFGGGAAEYKGFGDTPEQAIRNAEAAAQQLQQIREDRAYLAMGAVNITRGNDGQGTGFKSEVSLFRDNIQDPSLFDFIMVNAYELSNTATTVYDFYVEDDFGQSLQSVAESAGL